MDGPSPFAAQLGTNYAAIDEEADAINIILVNHTSEVKRLQEDIDELGAKYRALIAQQTVFTTAIAQHRALLAPVRRIPVDVLTEIFLSCLPTTHNPVISHAEPPFLLTRVCSSWRRLALGTPLLWASIHIPIPSDVKYSYDYASEPLSLSGRVVFPIPDDRLVACRVAERRATAIKEWLGRSGSCPLSISLFDKMDSTSVKIYDIILNALLPFRGRFEALTLSAPLGSLPRITCIPVEELPILRTLKISGSNTNQIPQIFMPNPSEFFAHGGSCLWAESGVVAAPMLREFSYSNIIEDIIAFPLKWERLTSLELYGIPRPQGRNKDLFSVVGIGELLTMCPLLRRCYIEIPAQLPRFPADPAAPSAAVTAVKPSCMPAIALYNLTDLTIHTRDVSLDGVLLDALDVPRLTSLEILSRISIPFMPFHMLLSRTASTLRRLTLDPGTFAPRALPMCLLPCTQVEALTLKRSHLSAPGRPPQLLYDADSTHNSVVLDDEFLTLLLAPTPIKNDTFDSEREEDMLLPRLTLFECATPATFSDACLLQVVKARKATAEAKNVARGSKSSVNSAQRVAKLERINILFLRPQRQTIYAELAAEGVGSHLSYPPEMSPTKSYSAHDGIMPHPRPIYDNVV